MRYTIQPGDTLSELAKKHGTTVAVLATANGIADPDKIYAGRTLWLPDPKVSEAIKINLGFWDWLKSLFRW